ncbi:hypothetical protein [Bradyrhizobium sp. STM 3562]|uniref:hypothetical protein n=1 Tax=Bradyrhizobium sp. STM 3562 TaxID=578924 RepID=UPI0038904DAE
MPRPSRPVGSPAGHGESAVATYDTSDDDDGRIVRTRSSDGHRRPAGPLKRSCLARKNPWLKWGGASLAALLSAILVALGVVLIVGLFKLHARSAPAVRLKVTSTAEQIRRGEAIAASFCDACHAQNGALTGGRDVAQELPLGTRTARRAGIRAVAALQI